MGITASDSRAATTDCESFYKELKLRESPTLLNRQGANPFLLLPPLPHNISTDLHVSQKPMSGEVKKRNSGINRKTFTHVYDENDTLPGASM